MGANFDAVGCGTPSAVFVTGLDQRAVDEILNAWTACRLSLSTILERS